MGVNFGGFYAAVPQSHFNSLSPNQSQGQLRTSFNPSRVLNFEKFFISTMELFIFGLRKYKILTVQID